MAKKKTKRRRKPARRRIKVRVTGGLRPRAERIVRTQEEKLYHEIEYKPSAAFKEGVMRPRGGERSKFVTVKPTKGQRGVRLIVGCLKEDFDPRTGMCLRTTAQKMVRPITEAEATRLQRRNPALLVITNPAEVEALGYSPTMVRKLGKTYKRFHFTNPSEAVEIWRPDEYPKGFVAIGECEMFKVRKENGRTVTRRFRAGNRPHVCTTASNKDVFILVRGDNPALLRRGLRIPSGTAVRIDYKVPPESGRNKWSSRWYHWHETNPRVVAHSSGKAVKITGPGLKVTPRGIIG